MAYDTESLKKGNNAPGATLETSDKEVAPAGLWRHPESGEEVITKDHPLFGNVQSEGIIRAGFEFVRTVDPSEHKSIVEQILEGKTSNEAQLAQLAAQIRELQSSKETSTAERDELAQLREEKRLRDLQSTDGAADSKVDAVKAGEAQGEKLVEENGHATDLSGDTRTATPKQTEKKGK